MTIEVYISVNQSFNPFTLVLPSARSRANLGRHSVPSRSLRSRRRWARGETSGELAVSGAQTPNLPAGEVLAMLPDLARDAAEAESDLRWRVVQLRNLGITWDLIGVALQLDEAQVRQRFEVVPSQ